MIKRFACFILLAVFFLSSLQYGKVKPLYLYYNPNFGARSLGMGNAFTGLADDLTAVYRNPAGIAELKGPRLFINYRTDNLSYDYSMEKVQASDFNQSYSYAFNSDLKNFDFVSIAAPVFFWDVKWNFALSYYRYYPYNYSGSGLGTLTTDYTGSGGTVSTDNNWLNVTGDNGIDVLAFTGAFYLTDYFSFGLTLQYFLNSGGLLYETASPGTDFSQDYTEKFSGTNVIVGLLFKPNKNFSIGLGYQFKKKTKLETEYTYQDNTQTIPMPVTTTDEADLTIPSQLSVGLMFEPFKWMLITFDYTVIYWNEADLSGYFDYTEDLEFPVKGDFSFTVKDNTNLRLGTELNFPLEKLTIFARAGLFGDKQIFVDSLDGQVKVVGYSFGLGVDFNEMIQLDLGYMRQRAAWDELAFIDPGSTVRTKLVNHIVALSLRFSFNKKEIARGRY